MLFDSYAPMLVCHDGDAPGDVNVTLPGDQKTVEGEPAPKTFTQEEVNKFLAADRRGHQEKYTKLEESYQTVLQDKNLTGENRDRLESELESLRASFRTKEQQIEHERQQSETKYQEQLKVASEAAERYEMLYTDNVIEASLRDAADKNAAWDSGQISALLRPSTSLQPVLTEDGQASGTLAPMVKFQDVDSEGNPIETLRTPMDAVKRMKEMPKEHGNLFRANVVSGIGQGAATGGVTPGSGAHVDVDSLTTEQHMKIRKENPGALGLRPRR